MSDYVLWGLLAWTALMNLLSLVLILWGRR